MKHLMKSVAVASLMAMTATGAYAAAHAGSVTVGMQREPPMLDPTAGAQLRLMRSPIRTSTKVWFGLGKTAQSIPVLRIAGGSIPLV